MSKREWLQIFDGDIGLLLQEYLDHRSALTLYSTCKLTVRHVFLKLKLNHLETFKKLNNRYPRLIVYGSDLHSLSTLNFTTLKHVKELWIDGLDQKESQIPISLEPLCLFTNLSKVYFYDLIMIDLNVLVGSNIAFLSMTKCTLENPLVKVFLSIRELELKGTIFSNLSLFGNVARLSIQSIFRQVIELGDLLALERLKLSGTIEISYLQCPKLVDYHSIGPVQCDITLATLLRSLTLEYPATTIHFNQFSTLQKLELVLEDTHDLGMISLPSLKTILLKGGFTNIDAFLVEHFQLLEFVIRGKESFFIENLEYTQVPLLTDFNVETLGNMDLQFLTFSALKRLEVGGPLLKSLYGIETATCLQELKVTHASITFIPFISSLVRLELVSVHIDSLDVLVGSQITRVSIHDCKVGQYQAIYYLKPWIYFIVTLSKFGDVSVDSKETKTLREFLLKNSCLNYVFSEYIG